jgi:hypothetical protein
LYDDISSRTRSRLRCFFMRFFPLRFSPYYMLVKKGCNILEL